MERFYAWRAIPIGGLIAVCLLSACSKKIHETIPEPGTISTGDIVLVKNDGRCDLGQIIQITGGSRKHDIPRKYECIEQPH